MTKNTLDDLNDHLFTQMERLCDEDLTPEELQREINRTESITKVSKEIISNAQLSLDARVKLADLPNINTITPKMLR